MIIRWNVLVFAPFCIVVFGTATDHHSWSHVKHVGGRNGGVSPSTRDWVGFP
jgi:hypothetical protein